MYMNRVEIAGYLAKKPEVRYLPSGTPVANARLGQTQRYQDGNQQNQEHTNWHNVVCYGVVADIAERLSKGDNVFVDGSLQVREFEPNDGSKRRRVVEVVARSVALITRIPGMKELADEQPHPESLAALPEAEDNESAEVWPR